MALEESVRGLGERIELLDDGSLADALAVTALDFDS